MINRNGLIRRSAMEKATETVLHQPPRIEDIEKATRDALRIRRNLCRMATQAEKRQQFPIEISNTQELFRTLKTMGAISNQTWREAKQKLSEIRESMNQKSFDAAQSTINALTETMNTVFVHDYANWIHG